MLTDRQLPRPLDTSAALQARITQPSQPVRADPDIPADASGCSDEGTINHRAQISRLVREVKARLAQRPIGQHERASLESRPREIVEHKRALRDG